MNETNLTPKEKAKQLFSQFKFNAKYVVLELIEENKYLLHPNSNFNSILHNRIDFLRCVKTELENFY